MILIFLISIKRTLGRCTFAGEVGVAISSRMRHVWSLCIVLVWVSVVRGEPDEAPPRRRDDGSLDTHLGVTSESHGFTEMFGGLGDLPAGLRLRASPVRTTGGPTQVICHGVPHIRLEPEDGLHHNHVVRASCTEPYPYNELENMVTYVDTHPKYMLDLPVKVAMLTPEDFDLNTTRADCCYVAITMHPKVALARPITRRPVPSPRRAAPHHHDRPSLCSRGSLDAPPPRRRTDLQSWADVTQEVSLYGLAAPQWRHTLKEAWAVAEERRRRAERAAERAGGLAGTDRPPVADQPDDAASEGGREGLSERG